MGTSSKEGKLDITIVMLVQTFSHKQEVFTRRLERENIRVMSSIYKVHVNSLNVLVCEFRRLTCDGGVVLDRISLSSSSIVMDKQNNLQPTISTWNSKHSARVDFLVEVIGGFGRLCHTNCTVSDMTAARLRWYSLFHVP